MTLISSFGLPRLFRLSLRRRSRANLMILLLLISLAIVSPFYFIYKPPDIVFRYLRYKYPEVLFSAPPRRDEKLAALTIDDAPSKITPSLLKILKRYNAHATFFVIGSQVDGNEAVLREIVEQKSELGNHAMYDTPAASESLDTLKEEITAVNDKINEIYNSFQLKRPGRYFRPGSGFFNRGMIDLVKSMGYRLVLGNVYPYDAQVKYSYFNARHILSMTRTGSIIIVHDNRPWTPATLERVCKGLTARGYRLVTVSELLASSVRSN